MQNRKPNFIIKLSFTIFLLSQSFVAQADTDQLVMADSLFDLRSYKEAMSIYQENYANGIYSPAMLLKMAFIADGTNDRENAALYLGKYYDLNPDPQIITKIKALTAQPVLEGYEVSDGARFFLFLTENRELIVLILTGLLLVSLILVLVNTLKSKKSPVYWPSFFLIVCLFLANNFLEQSNFGLITNSPTLILSDPSGAGELIQRVEPGHRVKIKGSRDIWYEVEWKNSKAFIKKSNVTRL
ncbi:tetratricopeptide repeat protein [Algoriphagus sediminis]|uniref:SH3 domain-containing protein n=1 Tax=Algoriphagus sediminis TaxID=3057113 RepID=A0ABT7YH40_9BACT|nr:hypothetical protein [Algoriphagus sediminis]MDN3205852.1 hypothetical protein [Algoriphagus sediminis]